MTSLKQVFTFSRNPTTSKRRVIKRGAITAAHQLRCVAATAMVALGRKLIEKKVKMTRDEKKLLAQSGGSHGAADN